jgi:glutathione S-transferase
MTGKAKIKIWGRKDSSNVQKVLWCCHELGVAYERIDLGGSFGGNKERRYLALNPNGVVPTIEDGNFVLWESNSIVRYLVDKYGEGRLLPSTPEGRASANRWMDWQLSTLGPVMVPLFWGLIRTPEEKQDKAAIKSAQQKAIRAWQILDDYLADRSYLSGEEFGMGDIPLGVWVYRWFNLPIEPPKMAYLAAWYDRLSKRQPYKTHIMTPIT